VPRLIAIAVTAVIAAGAAPAGAHDAAGHTKPAAPGVQHFPDDFPVPLDDEWGWELGGFGEATVERTSHLPIVFVHGNNNDAVTWYRVASELTDVHGYGYGDLWALSYNGVGCTNEGALFTPNTGYRGWTYQEDRAASTGCVITGNDQNVPDLKAFIEAVLAYTGAPKVHLVSHSLGVTVARKTLFDNPELYQRVAGFVAIAGANHGTSFCPPGSETTVESCNEIAAGTDWLAELNADESPAPVRWMTVYDGTGLVDIAFLGPYGDSPRLEGADVANCDYPGFYHNDLRVDPDIVADYAAFLTAVEADEPFACPDPPPPIPPGLRG
jgi:pimeloyl-ACP methyl ester carboxylesterase